jgi:MinD-like ATPase involved in chromosome partitioning or flagellar assembly
MAEIPAAGADEHQGRPGAWTAFGPQSASGPRSAADWPDAADRAPAHGSAGTPGAAAELYGHDAYGPADSHGPDPWERDPRGPEAHGTQMYGPDNFGPEAYGPASFGPDSYGPDTYGPDSYGLPIKPGEPYGLDAFGPAGRHGRDASADGPDAYSSADPYRQGLHEPSGHYGPADPYDRETFAPADPYDRETFAPADPYSAADLHGADPYGTDPRDADRDGADWYGGADQNGADWYGGADQNGADQYGGADQNGADQYGGAGTVEVSASRASRRGPGEHSPLPHGQARSAAAAGYGPDGAFGAADRPAGPNAEPAGRLTDHIGSSGSLAGSSAGAGVAPAPPHAPVDPTESLAPAFLLPGRRRAPSPGWRRVIYQATGGLMRVPSSGAELRRREMISRARAPVVGGHHRVAVMSLKGGVGKTTTTMGLGSTLASLRGDRIIAVDANPDRGTLSDKVVLETAATVRDLLNERGHIRRYADVRTFTSQAASRLEVLASDRDPTVSVAFSGQDYCSVALLLEHFYSICLTDCGTGLLHSAMTGVLRLADQIVLVSTASVDGARSASATLDWLAAHSYEDLVRNAVVVLSAVRQRSRSTVDLNRLEEHFAARCRAVTRIPYDAHLEEGAEVELEHLSRATADAYLALAAIVGDGLASPRATARP